MLFMTDGDDDDGCYIVGLEINVCFNLIKEGCAKHKIEVGLRRRLGAGRRQIGAGRSLT